MEGEAVKVCLLGAESTGKTTLCHALGAHLRAQGRSVAIVEEYLREWCVREGRTPRPEEQLGIAQEQEARVDAAAHRAEVVVADTSALMVAIYSAMLFEDGTLYQFALERLRHYDVVLVTGLDIEWVADGLQRDGPHVREPVDALVRDALDRAGVPYRVVYGSGEERLRNALAAMNQLQSEVPSRSWTWSCDKCSDPDCEHKLFTRLSG